MGSFLVFLVFHSFIDFNDLYSILLRSLLCGASNPTMVTQMNLQQSKKYVQFVPK